MFKRKKKEEPKKISFLHHFLTTAFSAILTAVVAGLLGYYLNTKLPELYFYADSPQKHGSVIKIETDVVNYGRGPATEIKVRYSFSKPVLRYSYSYSEGFTGALPSGNIIIGPTHKEIMFIVPRMMPQDKLPAIFVFKDQPVIKIKVFSKEVMGQPFSKWQTKKTRGEKVLAKIQNIVASLKYRIDLRRGEYVLEKMIKQLR